MSDFVTFSWPLTLPNEILVKAVRLQGTQDLSRVSLRQKQKRISQILRSELLQQGGASDHSAEWLWAITHTGDTVFAAAAQQKKNAHLGLDTERVINAVRADRLAKRILTPTEITLWQKTKLAWPDFVTLIFSLKEAAYKALSKSEQKGMGFQNFLVEWGDFGIETHIQVAIQPSKHEKPQKLSGNFVVFDNQVLSAVWQARRSPGA